ncbi:MULTISPECIES: murein hydrolase activator EnvC family protein [Bradyrhizobium]|jgi:murein hydrolase activator|uniref:murein hydrolase activator EnvC family protein n=1 Tax=Bradyrhizobium TaxID=374 RepID=UPI0004839EC7|nr:MULTISPECIES: peptidoglycan DD-metalloendopeptidase family protein [Bradyrhizobium]MCS3444719.1 septal ring factor EnvC (AmiA/AmiB activator) [Bradyrhizobium elkanii]MCS3564153.1 septal ring factor EnvC (AmiA/AmiB activator) [Bradyrhizobium elkanii]MCW2146015.1 septal ring factor EnvC (AmiA/AmiB activator) [Bradyrhizobium elkanii]MCW2354912.1 septal ring factor EnvC (AmiA/AmiB activator) [Bradyrhizobium elkanii]MCW2378842.1 septal ring factor EnvC (AmiA/AmiB activator) [Bradyrhizobium elkan
MQHKRDTASYSASHVGTARRRRLPASLPLSIAMFAAYPLAAVHAQATPSAQQPAPPAQQAATAETSPDAIKQREQELEAAREQQRKATELQEKLKADIAAIGQDRSKLNQQLIDIAGQVRGVETRTADAEARLQPLDGREREIRASLDSRRSEVIEVLAALQRAGRRTPPALLVRPEDALQSLRTAMLLGAVVPELRVRAEKLAADLGELVALRKTISTERDALAADRDKLREDQTRLAALVDERQRQQSAAEKDMEAEGARAIALSKQADNLQSLIAKMEQDLKSAAKAAATASLQGAPATVNGKPNLGALKDPARMSPAVAFASAKGLFSYPVNGTKIREFGGSDGAGGVQKGISLAAKPGAQVTTPCDGWVVYAGPFRSYGQLLILNAGGGYHVLIAGMERISVNIGQFVLTGEPVATMGSTSQVASILATNASQPVLYVEFRKDGTPIDPGPWWAANEGEKVRG